MQLSCSVYLTENTRARRAGSGTALSLMASERKTKKNYIYIISIKALFSWCYPVACWTFKRALFFLSVYIWFDFFFSTTRLSAYTVSCNFQRFILLFLLFIYFFVFRFFLNFPGVKRERAEGRRKALNGNFYESLMQDEIQLLFLSFFIFMEMKKACAHLIRSYSPVKRKKIKKEKATNTTKEI